MTVSRHWKNCVRLEFSPARCGVPDVVHFGRYNYVRAGPGLSVHAHEQAMEFCFLLRGRQVYRVGQRYYQLSGGDVFVTFPDEPHSTGDAPEEKGVLYWLIVKIPEDGNDFIGLKGAEAAGLKKALTTLPARRFRSTKRTHAFLDGIATHYFSKESPLRTVAMHNQIIALLLEVITAARSRNHHARHTRVILDRITRLIEAHLSEPLSVTKLATESGLSVPRFKAWFKEQTGVPPGEYGLRMRVEEARRRLGADETSITEIGYALGFSSSQYFATVVKRYTGLTPRQIRALASVGVKSAQTG
ncbi:helix-turn-helix domain-containing protein [Oleiharenicola lentus]|uniref:helix-turn-helix domain-containing protein n=1 Tax=Oleiharenicola lentus TaxID=2508720 RepID=UPI003F660D29